MPLVRPGSLRAVGELERCISARVISERSRAFFSGRLALPLRGNPRFAQ